MAVQNRPSRGSTGASSWVHAAGGTAAIHHVRQARAHRWRPRSLANVEVEVAYNISLIRDGHIHRAGDTFETDRDDE
jgi:hypothetical protein